MPNSRLEHGTIKLRELISEYQTGRIVVPEFQREYVWKTSRAPKLIDSLYRGYPISSLLLWQSHEAGRSRRASPKPTRSGSLSWLIDGQQRVITLSRSLLGNEGIEVVFSPEKREFRLANAATRQSEGWFSLSEVWDDEGYRTLRRGFAGAQGEKYERELDQVRAILEYEVPFVRMVDHTFPAAVDAFTRINTLGVKLKQEDIESAQVAAKHTGFIADHVTPFLQQMHRDGFTRMTVAHLFRACAFLAIPDGRSRTPLHELSPREVQAAWTRTKRAATEVRNLVRSELGLVNMEIIWTGSLLVPAMVLLDQMSARERDPRAIAGWMASAALLKRYSKAAHTALDQDLKACRQADPIGALLTNIRRRESYVNAIPADFAGSLNDRGGLFGAFVACRHRGGRDLFTSAKIVMQSNIHRHHILPRAQFDERQRTVADTVANVAFITDTTNRAISMSGPEVYLERVDEAVLKSQCIPLDRSLWRIDRHAEFMQARRELLAEAFNDFLRESLPGRRVG